MLWSIRRGRGMAFAVARIARPRGTPSGSAAFYLLSRDRRPPGSNALPGSGASDPAPSNRRGKAVRRGAPSLNQGCGGGWIAARPYLKLCGATRKRRYRRGKRREIDLAMAGQESSVFLAQGEHV